MTGVSYNKKEKVCQMCGKTYYGSAVSKYCVVCKVDAMQEQRNKNARKNYAEKRGNL